MFKSQKWSIKRETSTILSIFSKHVLSFLPLKFTNSNYKFSKNYVRRHQFSCEISTITLYMQLKKYAASFIKYTYVLKKMEKNT